MCDGPMVLKYATPRLCCTADVRCWCNKIDYRIPLALDECMSPAEILEECSKELSDKDKEYLTGLTKYEFVG